MDKDIMRTGKWMNDILNDKTCTKDDTAYIQINSVEFSEDVLQKICDALAKGQEVELGADKVIKKIFDDKVLGPYLERVKVICPNVKKNFSTVEAWAILDNKGAEN